MSGISMSIRMTSCRPSAYEEIADSSISGQLCFVTQALKHLEAQLPVGGVVIHQQDAKRQFVAISLSRAAP